MDIFHQNFLPECIRTPLSAIVEKGKVLQEIRFRIGQPVMYQMDGQEYILGMSGGQGSGQGSGIGGQRNGGSEQGREIGEQGNRIGGMICEKQDIDRMLRKASEYSLYAYQDKVRQGFITLRGGHRLGVSGQAVCEDGKIKTLQNISGLNLRIAHEKKGSSKNIYPWLWENGRFLSTLIISPPGGGKTTILRDLIRLISDGSGKYPGYKVGVVDERSELAACYQGIAQNDLGIRTDIMDACMKPEGILCLIRSMSPQVIAADEIGGQEDKKAVIQAVLSGCRMLCSIHGASFRDVRCRTGIKSLVNQHIFDRYVILAGAEAPGKLLEIRNGAGEVLFKGEEECFRKLRAVL